MKCFAMGRKTDILGTDYKIKPSVLFLKNSDR
jgi:hypothetical protein